MSDLDRAWAAGFFEGEGTVTAHKNRLRIAVTQNGGEEARRLLLRFAGAVGDGNVTGPYVYPNSLGSKPRWTLQFYSGRAERVMQQIIPYMSGPKVDRFYELSESAT